MNIGDICNRIVVCIGVDEPAREAAVLMGRLHVGTLVVTGGDGESSAPIGILTDRDLVVEVMAQGLDPATVTVNDVMHDELLVGEEGDDVGSALELMQERGVRRMPVVDGDGALIGIVALDDMLQVYARDIERMASIVGAPRLQDVDLRP